MVKMPLPVFLLNGTIAGGFFCFTLLSLCSDFSRLWSFSIVERGSGSMEVKVLPVGDCCSYWFDFVGGTHFSGFFG